MTRCRGVPLRLPAQFGAYAASHGPYIRFHRLLHGRTVKESTPLLPENTGLQANPQGGKFTTQQKQTGVTNYPPIVSFACNHTAPSRFKDMIANLKNSQGFTVIVISEPFVGSANATAVDVPPGFDEWSISGLTKYACTFVIRYMRQQQGVQVQIKAPCVKASAFSMECELYKFVDITHSVAGEHNGMLILVRVKCIRLRKDMLSGTVVLTASTRK
ncbi:hypothetical protein F4604DRAFT_1940941 [Suillus subluteus]|nr:hypothetical protein F4604DRAFT_1995692 [Suillus subluteus]KAG1839171.1 hypothetical protein F4604DRAFT_1940941 [Suillus subluteus]